jgi:regulatory protein
VRRADRVDSAREDGDRAPARRGGPSLLARALAYLARREHSRVELARKLARYAASDDEVQQVLATLAAQELLSEQRFADVLVRSRGEGHGAARVRQELQAHRLDPELVRSATAAVRATELERARALWERRYGRAPKDPAERLRQMRFLAARGFAADVIRRVVAGADDD